MVRFEPPSPDTIDAVAQAIRLVNEGNLDKAADYLTGCFRYASLADVVEDIHLFTAAAVRLGLVDRVEDASFRHSIERIAGVDRLHIRARKEHDAGNFDAAATLYAEELELANEIAYDHAVIRIGHETARIHLARGNFLAAEHGFRESLRYYASQREEENLDAAIHCLVHLGRQTLAAPDRFLASLPAKLPFGTPATFLEIRAMALVGEFNEYFRTRTMQKGLAAIATDVKLFGFALQAAIESAAFVNDEATARIAHIYLSEAHPRLDTTTARRRLTPRAAAVSDPRFRSPDDATRGLDELFELLERDDRDGDWVYRGQTRTFPAPLLPSAFRGILGSDDVVLDSTSPLYKHSLRLCGRRFVGEYNDRFRARLQRVFTDVPTDAAAATENVFQQALKSPIPVLEQRTALVDGRVLPWNEGLRRALSVSDREILDRHTARWQPFMDSYHRRCIRTAFFEPFGYFLGTTLAQHYGLHAEGLDATRSLEVAAFFATFDAASQYTAPTEEGIGVIYRFPSGGSDVHRRQIRDYDYYTLPPILDARDVLDRLEREGIGADDAVRCFEIYGGAVYLDNLKDTDLFFLPKGAVASSRIGRQQAVILLPDELRKDVEGRRPSQSGITFPEFRYVEDLTAREGVEAFYFRHGSRVPGCVRLTREELWPRDDPFIAIIVALISAIYPLGFFTPDIMPQRLDLIDGGWDHAGFLSLCEKLAVRHRLVLLDHQQMEAASQGALLL